MQPTLFIGLGGTGIYVATRVNATLLENTSTANNVDGIFQIVCIDTYTHFVEDQNLGLPTRYIQNIGFNALPFIEQACLNDENLQKWFDCEQWKRAALPPAHFDLALNPTINRQLGRLCLYHDLAAGNYSKVRQSIHHTLLAIQQRTPTPPLVIICASLIGGTGSAITQDIAYLVHHTLATMGSYAYVLGVFALGNVFASALSRAPEERRIRFILNEVAAIKEIQHFARSRYEFGPQDHLIAFDNVEPFNSYWLIGGDRNELYDGKWPNYYFAMIASELCTTILSEDIAQPPAMLELQSLTHFAERMFYRLKRLTKGFEYEYIRAPLTTDEIGDWKSMEDIYNRYLKDPNHLCPHNSREF